MTKITTIGSCTEDITLYTEDGILIDNKNDLLRKELLCFERGSKIEINKYFFSFGGGASNASVSLSRLGFKTSVITSIGKDERGRRMIKNFQNHKVDAKYINVIKNKNSAFSMILLDRSKERITFTIRGASDNLVICEKNKNAIKQSDWSYISSMSGGWKKNINDIFDISNKIAWNPGRNQIEAGAKFLRKYFKKTNILFVNQDEATEIILSSPDYKKKNKVFFNNIKNLLKALHGFGPELVVITRGKKGADVYDGKNFFHQDIIKEQSRVDATGVGDAFNSSFLAGWILFKNDIKKSLFLGALNSASVISQQGAQRGLLEKKDLKLI